MKKINIKKLFSGTVQINILFNKHCIFFLATLIGIFASLVIPYLNKDFVKKADAAPCGVEIVLNTKNNGSQTANVSSSQQARNASLAYLEPAPCNPPPGAVPPPPPNPDPVTLVLWAITCNYESNLPDWNYISGLSIPETTGTAQQYVNNSNGNCKFEAGWTFRRMRLGDNYPGITVGTTDSSGSVTVSVPFDDTNIPWVPDPNSDYFMRRIYVSFAEKAGYYPFTDPGNLSPVSAEMRCWHDAKRYDNLEYVGQEPYKSGADIVPGGTYHCIAFNALLTPPSATINVDATACGSGGVRPSWNITGGISGSGSSGTYSVNPGSGTTYNITATPPSGYTNMTYSPGSSVFLTGGGNATFYLSCGAQPVPICSVDHFRAVPPSVSYGGASMLEFGGGANNACTSGTLAGGIYGGGTALASNGYTYPGNTATTQSLTSQTCYTYTVCRGSQCDSTLSPLCVPVASAPPTTPTGFSASANSCGNNSLNLSWNASSGASSYQVYRNGTLIYNSSGTSFTDTGLSLGVTYNYTITASNGSGASPSASTSGTVASACGVPPAAPTGFVASPSSCGNYWLNLSWNASGGATNYEVYRGGVLVYSGSGTAFSDTGLSPGASYSYTITASNSYGTSPSGSTAGTVASACLTAPTNFTATSGACGTNQVTLSWSPVPGATSYELHRGGQGGPSNPLYTGSQTSFTDTITSGWRYDVRAINSGGAGPWAVDPSSGLEGIGGYPPPPCGGISVSLTANPISMTLPTNSTTLSWTTTGSPTSCTASNFWSGSKTASGGSEVRTGMTAQTYTYTITCSKAGVADASATVNVVVNPAPVSGISVDLSASPTSMTLPTNSTTLSWTTTGSPTSCTASNFWSGSKTASGGSEVRTGMTAQTYTYTITCSKAGVPDASDTVSVVVNSGAVGSCSNIGSGGTISYPVISGTQYVVHTFTADGTLTIPNGGVNSVDYLVVGGGGGGGGGETYAGNGDAGGGGGAGGHLSGTATVASGATFPAVVGAGGLGGGGSTAGIVGGNSSFNSVTALGGGRGAREEGSGGAGGSGGGAGGSCSGARSGGTGTSGQGYNGGANNVVGCDNRRDGAGGGGAGGVGAEVGYGFAGSGGSGFSNSITGSSITRAGGGGGGEGGGETTGGGGAGGSGGGGAGGTANFDAGNNGGNGSANTGSGGGGGARGNPVGRGGNGGAGVVIVRYACVPYSYPDLTATSPTPSSAISGTPLTFTSTISNSGPGSTGSSFSNFFQIASAGSGGGTISNLTPSTMAALGAGVSANATSPAYTFSSAGTYSVRACADKSSSTDTGTIPESNENNNCGGWTDVAVSPPAPPFDYSLSNSGNVTVTKAGIDQYGTNIITKSLSAGTSQPVDLSVGSLPSGVTASISNQSCNPTCSSTVTFTVTPSATVGTFLMSITGSPLSKSTSFNLTINPATSVVVSCSASPSSGAKVGDTITWTANASGGSGSGYIYSWSGTSIPTSPAPAVNPYNIVYSTVGTKTARATVTDSLGNTGSCPDATTIINFDPTIIEF